MKSPRLIVSAALALLTAGHLLAPRASASFTDLVNLGTNSFTVDPGATTAPYSQTASSLDFNGTIALGDTLGGIFFALQDWSSYETFGLRMSLMGTNSDLPFSLQFFNSAFNIINTYQGNTAGLSLNTPTVVMLSLSEAGTMNFSSVAGMQFTWDGGGPMDTSLTEVVGFNAPDSGFFVAQAPGGVVFNTGTNSTFTFETTLPANATNWDPATFTALLSPHSASWAMLCDSNAKTDVTPVDHRETLRKVNELPVTAWNYKHDPHHRYVGPMAQDFHAAFGLGHDDKHISTLDTDGVTLSALKGLIEELRERQERSAAQARRLAELEAELRCLSEKLSSNLPPAP
jgi:hypothetical protein